MESPSRGRWGGYVEHSKYKYVLEREIEIYRKNAFLNKAAVIYLCAKIKSNIFSPLFCVYYMYICDVKVKH